MALDEERYYDEEGDGSFHMQLAKVQVLGAIGLQLNLRKFCSFCRIIRKFCKMGGLGSQGPADFFPGKEVAFYAIGVADADLDVIFVTKAGARVEFGAFGEDAADGVEGR
jgi:hypothetical protein